MEGGDGMGRCAGVRGTGGGGGEKERTPEEGSTNASPPQQSSSELISGSSWLLGSRSEEDESERSWTMIWRSLPFAVRGVGRGRGDLRGGESTSSSLSRMTRLPPRNEVRVADELGGTIVSAWIGIVEVEATQAGRGLPLESGDRSGRSDPIATSGALKGVGVLTHHDTGCRRRA